MASARLKSIAPGIQMRSGIRGKSFRFFCMIDRQRFTKMSELPPALALSKSGAPSRELKAEFSRFVDECAAKASDPSSNSLGRLRIPTIAQLIETYKTIAWQRNANPNYASPSARTIESAVKNFGYCVDASGLPLSRPCSDLFDPDMIRRIFDNLSAKVNRRGEHLSGITAWSYVASLQSVTADWTLIEYRKQGFVVTQPLMPDFGKAKDAASYRELPPSLIRQIWDWYLTLEKSGSRDCVFYATCMLELAIRPSDIALLTLDNFPLAPNGHHRLAYTPHKTRESSNRRVDIEIPDATFEKLRAAVRERWDSGGRLMPNVRWVSSQINASLRLACAMKTDEFEKASYELRKLCIHTILHTPVENGGGIEQAVRLSGDRRDTIEKYYCDPYKSHTALPSRPLEAFLGRIAPAEQP